jgi:uncharacterized membrane protein
MLSTEFIGRLHPLIVHLPIGILLFACALLLFQRFRRVDMSAAISLSLLLGAITATAACVAGWFLAQSGEYEAELVAKHQWTGIATAGLGFLTYFLKRFQGISATVMVVVLSVAGHYGGTLTHGEDYLFPKKKTPSVLKPLKVDSLQNIDNQTVARQLDTAKGVSKATRAAPQIVERRTFLYRDKVIPILEAKCYSCHSATKKKGGLRLDSEAFIQEGGKNGPILTAGNPDNSTLFTHLLLPEDDDKHMPPKGKPQLSEQEVATLHYWIKRGASFQEIVEKMEVAGQKSETNAAVNSTVNSATTGAVIPALSSLKFPKMGIKDSLKMGINAPTKASETERLQARIPSVEAAILSKKIEAATPSVLATLKQENISITTFGEGSNYLSANFINVKNYNSDLINSLQSINNQLVRLRLSNQPVTDADVKILSAFKNITSLNLEKTGITDAALQHLQSLPNLEQINLYGTNITDKGIKYLIKYPNLKTVYLWQTKVTPSGIEQLKKAAPNVKIEAGGFQFPK